MASRQTYTFALIKALYDDKQDLLTALRPFFLGVLRIDAATSATEAKNELITKQAMDLPVHVINMCADAAEAEGLLKSHRSSMGEAEYVLTHVGQEQALDVCALADAKRRVRHANAFLVACMKERGIEIEPADLDATLKRLIGSNLESVVGFVVAGGDGDTLDVKTGSAIEEALADCISIAAQTQSDVYETLRDLVYGSVILATLSQGDEQLIETVQSPLDGLVAFVDTNWVLGVMQLDTPARNLAAMELARLARQSGIQLRILDFDFRETQSLLKFYEIEYDTGRLPLDPQSVFMQMKLRGMKPSDVLLIRTYLEDALAEHGIVIEETEIDPARHKPEDRSWVHALMTLKQAQTPRAALVDLSALAYVRSKRGRTVPDLEHAGFILLSCDGRLANFNRTQMGHAESATYPDVVLDKTLTTLLWLKNPGLDVPLEAVVAAHSRRLLHRQAVWHQVVAELSRAANTGAVSRHDISIFLASSGPQVIADEVGSVQEVTPEVIARMLVQAKREHEEEIEAVRNEIRAEGEIAVAAVTEAAKKSVEGAQLTVGDIVAGAESEKKALSSKVELLEKGQQQASTELLEQAKTRAWIWAFVVPVAFGLLVIVMILAFRTKIEAQIGASDFSTIVIPVTLAFVALGGAGIGALTRRVALRRAETRIKNLFSL